MKNATNLLWPTKKPESLSQTITYCIVFAVTLLIFWLWRVFEGDAISAPEQFVLFTGFLVVFLVYVIIYVFKQKFLPEPPKVLLYSKSLVLFLEGKEKTLALKDIAMIRLQQSTGERVSRFFVNKAIILPRYELVVQMRGKKSYLVWLGSDVEGLQAALSKASFNIKRQDELISGNAIWLEAIPKKQVARGK